MSDPQARALLLFDDYTDLDAPERERRLALLAQAEPQVHAALRALLDADGDEADGVLGRSPLDLLMEYRSRSPHEEHETPADAARLGARLGPWRVRRLIAQGGMGAVYEASRDDGQYQQRVALKCVRMELSTEALMAAFRRERELLARLDHPGIAALVDGGVDTEGNPWFAMRYVEGDAIDAWCDAHRASVAERVRMLAEACDALAYAHAQGVTHGDIKPSNVLVSDDGRVQLVDFGISSALDGPSSHLAATPGYTPPESLAGRVGGATVDVYAMGVLMYRLLCDQWPAPPRSLHGLLSLAPTPPPQRMDQLLHGAAEAVAIARGAGSVASLAKQLSGGLAAIALKAVAPAPDDRYPSAEALADDLRRWAERRPLAAQSRGPAAHAAFWLRRNWLPATLAALLGLTLAAGGATLVWQQRQAEHEARATTRVSELFASTLGTATLSGVGATPFSSRELLAKTETALRQLGLGDHPAVLGRALAVLARSQAAIGDYPDAERLSQEAHAALRGTADGDGYIVVTRVAMLNLRAQYAQAATLATRELARLPHTGDAERQKTRIALLTELARAQWGGAETTRAVNTLDDALAQGEALGDRELLAQLLMVRSEFASRLLRLSQGEADARRAVALAEPVNPVLADDAREQLVRILRRRQSPDLLRNAEQLLHGRRQTLGGRHPKTGWAWIYYGEALRWKPGAEAMAKGLALIERAYGREHPDYAFASSIVVWGEGYSARKKIGVMRDAVRVLERRTGPRSERTLSIQGSLGALLLDTPLADRGPQDTEAAFSLLAQVVRDKDLAGLPSPSERLTLAHGITVRGSATRLPEARRLLDRAASDAPRYYLPSDAYFLMLAQFDDKLLYREGHRALADHRFAARLDANRDFLRSGRIDRDFNNRTRALTLLESLLYRALYAYESCRDPEAERHLREALAFGKATSIDLYETTARDYLAALRATGRMRSGADSVLIAPDELEAVNRRAQHCEGASTHDPR